MKEQGSRILAQLIEARIERIHTMLPATIVSFNGATMRATVKPTLKKVVGPPDAKTALDYPLIFEVPVDTTRSAQFEERIPYEAGDPVTIAFYGRSIEHTVRDISQRDPTFSRKHHLTDAVILGGRVTDADSLPAGWSTDWIFKVRGSETAIRIHPNGDVTIQCDADKKIRLGPACNSSGCGGSDCGSGAENDIEIVELPFDQGMVEIAIGDDVEGEDSKATGSVRCVIVSGGTWGVDAYGILYLYDVRGTFIDDEALFVDSASHAAVNGSQAISPGDPCSVAVDGAILGSRHKCWADSHVHICPACGSPTSAPTKKCPDVSSNVEIGGGNPDQGAGCGGSYGGGCCG